MAFSVTEDLDVFDALALLLKPGGVMVKNELYLEEMSSVFDYTLQISYESPKICSQAMTFGSNRVDFLRKKTKDHNVELLLLKPLKEISDPFEFIHDYRKNDARAQGKCNIPRKEHRIAKSQVQEKVAGILLVLDAENARNLDDGSIEELIYYTVLREGFTPISTPSRNLTSTDAVVVVMEEGYVITRIWPEHKYCAFDISLWGSFHKTQDVRAALLRAIGSDNVSSFRVIVGGMWGSTTWGKDQSLIGPQQIQARNCDPDTSKADVFADQKRASTVIINEIINFVPHRDDILVVVLCGTKADTCLSSEALEKHSNVKKVLYLWACPNITQTEVDSLTKLSSMYQCEESILDQLREALYDQKLDVFVIDESAPFEMGQILNSVWSNKKNRVKWLQENNIFSAIVKVPINPDGEKIWQHNFLERYRKDVSDDPIARAELVLKAGRGSFTELGLVSRGHKSVIRRLHNMVENFHEKLASKDNEDIPVNVEIRKIAGGVFEFDDNFQPKEYVHENYDSQPALEQFNQQQPLGRESIFQLQLNDDEVMLSVDDLKMFAEKSFQKRGIIMTFETFYVGDGAVISSIFSEGSVVLVWDGRSQVDINLFSFDDIKELADAFLTSFIYFSGSRLKKSLRDDFPRGIGRVLNFRIDIDTQQMLQTGHSDDIIIG